MEGALRQSSPQLPCAGKSLARGQPSRHQHGLKAHNGLAVHAAPVHLSRRLQTLIHGVGDVLQSQSSGHRICTIKEPYWFHCCTCLRLPCNVAVELFFVLATRFRAVKADLTLERGTVLWDIGLLMRDQRRTQTVVYAEDGTLLHISCDEVRQLCFQKLRFGDYFLQLAAIRGGFMTPAGRRKTPIPQTDAASPPASC